MFETIIMVSLYMPCDAQSNSICGGYVVNEFLLHKDWYAEIWFMEIRIWISTETIYMSLNQHRKPVKHTGSPTYLSSYEPLLGKF